MVSVLGGSVLCVVCVCGVLELWCFLLSCLCSEDGMVYYLSVEERVISG